MGQNIKTVPLHDALNAHRTEYIYFRTDHHWTALGAYYAYVQFCNVKGITPHDLSDYEVSQYTGFLGSFYNDGGKPQAMADDPDTVNAYHPVSSTAAMKYGSSEDSELTGGKVIFDESTAAASLKYGAFIMGVMNNGMSILGVGIDYQQVIKGLVLLAAVIFDVYNKSK